MGKTTSGGQLSRPDQKHPHSRGEDEMYQAFQPEKIETPPLTWGRLINTDATAKTYGNTPTHVGKTIASLSNRLHVKKHPHSRGEDLPQADSLSPHLETPPLTWGRLQNETHQNCRRRNTPTHVGKTMTMGLRSLQSKKHPHSRGEDSNRL